MEMKMKTNNFEAKDATRIADIVRKSNGDPRKAQQLASNMAKAITKADKALRRAYAAQDAGENTLAAFFFVRYRELSGCTPDEVPVNQPEPMPELRIVGLKFIPKEKHSASPRVYFWLADRATKSFDEFIGQRFLPQDLFRPLMDEVLRPVGLLGTKASWSQKAGCSCPCSPGFILRGVEHYDFDIHVDYEPKKVKATARRSA
jgi:hypothetical protein